MELIPRLHKELQVSCDASRLTSELAAALPSHGVVVAHHLPGIRVHGHVIRPTSLSLGQEVRVDVRSMGEGVSTVILDSRYHYPGLDITHQNEKNVSLLESLVAAAQQKCAEG